MKQCWILYGKKEKKKNRTQCGSSYSGSGLKGADLDPNWFELQAFSEAFKSFMPTEIALSFFKIREFIDISILSPWRHFGSFDPDLYLLIGSGFILQKCPLLCPFIVSEMGIFCGIVLYFLFNCLGIMWKSSTKVTAFCRIWTASRSQNSWPHSLMTKDHRDLTFWIFQFPVPDFIKFWGVGSHAELPSTVCTEVHNV